MIVDSLIEAQLSDAVGRIVKELQPDRIILFGSQVYGYPNQDSDVDLLIIMKTEDRPIKRVSKVSRLLRPRPFPVDIFVRTPDEIQHRVKMGDQFIMEILTRGKVLYDRGIS
jgi:predicted nucleotidyltransferase